MRYATAIPATLLMVAVSAVPAAAGHRDRLPDSVRHQLKEARLERDHRLAKLDRAMDAELRRAKRKYAGNRYELKDARVRLDHWFEQNRLSIESDFLLKRDTIRARALRSPIARDVALAKADRDFRLRKLERRLKEELFRAERKYRHDRYGLRAARKRLDIWAASNEAKIRREFRARKSEIECATHHDRRHDRFTRGRRDVDFRRSRRVHGFRFRLFS